ncbi:MAG: RDD family protein [Deltaproteobacteria bacterium]|nr:RDD family protein [Deltaproteobacteria bacterium]
MTDHNRSNSSPEHRSLSSDEGQGVGHRLQLASRGSRLLAYVIDNIISVMLLLPVMQQLGVLADGVTINGQVTAFLLSFLSIVLVHGYLLQTRGQSIGKLIMGIQIVRVDGTRLTLGPIVFRRYLPVQLSGMIPAFGPLLVIMDSIWIFRDDFRCIHDHIAGTVVINYQPDI